MSGNTIIRHPSFLYVNLEGQKTITHKIGIIWNERALSVSHFWPQLFHQHCHINALHEKSIELLKNMTYITPCASGLWLNGHRRAKFIYSNNDPILEVCDGICRTIYLNVSPLMVIPYNHNVAYIAANELNEITDNHKTVITNLMGDMMAEMYKQLCVLGYLEKM